MSKDSVSQEEMKTLKRAFHLYDHDGDGTIDSEEFKTIVMSLDPRMTEESATLLAGEIDTKGKGTIGFDGFVCAMVKLAPFTNATTSLPEHVELRKWNTCPPHLRNTRHEEDDLMDCFRAFDTNHDGLISRTELEKVMCKLGEKLSKQDIQDMMAEADSNEDGYIDFEEFKHLLS